MGIFSWLRSRRSARRPERPRRRQRSLVRYRYEDPKLEPIERDAAADIRQVEEDAKYFGGDTPGIL